MTTTAQVVKLDAEGLAPARIATRLGLTQSRVERILDEQAGVKDFPFVLPAIVEPPPPPPKRAAGKPEPAPQLPRPRTEPGARRIQHGTPNGARVHRERGEASCDECLEARRAYQRELTARKNAGLGPLPGREVKCGTNSGYMRHRKDKTSVCDLCRVAHNQYQADYNARRGAG